MLKANAMNKNLQYAMGATWIIHFLWLWHFKEAVTTLQDS
jgi:hypothetical protein